MEQLSTHTNGPSTHCLQTAATYHAPVCKQFLDGPNNWVVLVFSEPPGFSIRQLLFEGGFHHQHGRRDLEGDVWVTANDPVGRFYAEVITGAPLEQRPLNA